MPSSESRQGQRRRNIKADPLPKGKASTAPGVSSASPKLPQGQSMGKASGLGRSKPVTTGGNERTRLDASKTAPKPKTHSDSAPVSRAPSVREHEGQSDMDAPRPFKRVDPDTGADLFEVDQRRAADVMMSEAGGDGESVPTDWHYSDIARAGDDISEYLTETQLAQLSSEVWQEYEIDVNSRTDVLDAYDVAMSAARNEKKPKTYPFKNAANIRYPLINSAALQFAARAYPAIVSGADVVKVGINGQDDEQGAKAQRAKRVSEHMSYQCLREMPEWETQIDELLHHLPLAGTCFRSIYYDSELGRNTCELVTLKEFVINNDARVFDETPRYTRIREFYPYQIQEKMRSGFYRDVPAVIEEVDQDAQKMRTILEQHRRQDLDGDGYPEPYVVTIDKLTRDVLRVVPSADLEKLMVGEDEQGRYLSKAQHEPMYVRYVFMPDPEGRMHGMGFGLLLGSISEAINTTFNQIIDAAHLQNTGGGFLGGGVDFGKKREARTRPGEWRQLKAYGTDIRAAIVPHEWKGPSPTLFNVLGLLIEAGKEIGSIKDVLSGDASMANMPVGTTMALIEQGLQAFTAIYKRIYRSMTREFELMYRLNSLYLDDESYFNFGDSEKFVARVDYAQGDMDVTPVSDPTTVTTMQKMQKAEFGLRFKGQPHINDAEIDRRAFDAAGIDNAEGLFAKPDEQQAQKAALMDKLTIEEMEAKIAKMQAEAVDKIASAESKEMKTQIDEADAIIGSITKGRDLMAPPQETGPQV